MRFERRAAADFRGVLRRGVNLDARVEGAPELSYDSPLRAPPRGAEVAGARGLRRYDVVDEEAAHRNLQTVETPGEPQRLFEAHALGDGDARELAGVRVRHQRRDALDRFRERDQLLGHTIPAYHVPVLQ